MNPHRNLSGNVLDLVFVTDPDACTLDRTIDPLLKIDSHHEPIDVRLNFGNNICRLECDSTPTFKFHKCNFHDLSAYISSLDFEVILGVLSIDAATQKFSEILMDGFDRFIPKSSSRKPKPAPWYDQELIRLKNAKNNAHHSYVRHGQRLQLLQHVEETISITTEVFVRLLYCKCPLLDRQRAQEVLEIRQYKT